MNLKPKSFLVYRLLFWALLLGAATQSPAATAPDFDGDGFADLAVGAPGEDVSGVSNAGSVNVIYGTATGLSASGNQFWTQNSSGILDSCESNDRFGSALAAGDFNHDGFADLAVGVPYERVAGFSEAGAVNIIYGAATGLSASGNQFWTQDSSGILEKAEAGDHFGATLAVGDFNGDGIDDLAIGVSGEDDASISNAGGVNVLYGTFTGLSSINNQFFSLKMFINPVTGTSYTAAADDQFGFALASGDFGVSSHTDLAIGIPEREIGSAPNAGAVIVLYGSPSRFTTLSFQFWAQTNTPDLSDASEADDEFGYALAAGNFGKTSHSDLAVGVPGEDFAVSGASVVNAGAVNVIYGSSTGLTTSGNQLWTQDSSSIQEVAEGGDAFGFHLVAANFGYGSQADLAIGVPGEDLGSVGNAGGTNLIYGSSSGLSSTNNRFWAQSNVGIAAGADDRFGSDLAAANFGKSSHADLAVGVPQKEVSGTSNAGAVVVLYGSSSGLTPSSSQLWTQGAGPSGTLQDLAEANDEFGLVGRRCWRKCPPDPGPFPFP